MSDVAATSEPVGTPSDSSSTSTPASSSDSIPAVPSSPSAPDTGAGSETTETEPVDTTDTRPAEEVDPATTTREDVAATVPPVDTPAPTPGASGVLLPEDGPHDVEEAALRAAEAEIETVADELDPTQTSPPATSGSDTTPTAAPSVVDGASTSDATTPAASSTPPTATDPSAAIPPSAPTTDAATTAAEGDYAGLSDEEKSQFDKDEGLSAGPPA